MLKRYQVYRIGVRTVNNKNAEHILIPEAAHDTAKEAEAFVEYAIKVHCNNKYIIVPFYY